MHIYYLLIVIQVSLGYINQTKSVYSKFYTAYEACSICIQMHVDNMTKRTDGISEIPQNIAQYQALYPLSFVILSDALIFAVVQDIETGELFYVRSASVTVHPEEEYLVLAENLNLALLNSENEFIYTRYNPSVKDQGIITDSLDDISGTQEIAEILIVQTNKIQKTNSFSIWKSENTYTPVSAFLFKGGHIGIGNSIKSMINDQDRINYEQYRQKMITKAFEQLETRMRRN